MVTVALGGAVALLEITPFRIAAASNNVNIACGIGRLGRLWAARNGLLWLLTQSSWCNSSQTQAVECSLEMVCACNLQLVMKSDSGEDNPQGTVKQEIHGGFMRDLKVGLEQPNCTRIRKNFARLSVTAGWVGYEREIAHI